MTPYDEYSTLIDQLEEAQTARIAAHLDYEVADQMYRERDAEVRQNRPHDNGQARAIAQLAVARDADVQRLLSARRAAWEYWQCVECRVEILRDRISALRLRLSGRL